MNERERNNEFARFRKWWVTTKWADDPVYNDIAEAAWQAALSPAPQCTDCWAVGCEGAGRCACKCHLAGVSPAGTRQPDDKRPSVAALLEELSLCGLNWCIDLVEDGTPWEAIAEPEPQYFESLTEAMEFRDKLIRGDSVKGEGETVPECVKLVGDREPTVDEIRRGMELEPEAIAALGRNKLRSPAPSPGELAREIVQLIRHGDQANPIGAVASLLRSRGSGERPEPAGGEGA